MVFMPVFVPEALSCFYLKFMLQVHVTLHH